MYAESIRPDGLYSIESTAVITGFTRGEILQFRKIGRLTFLRLGKGGRLLTKGAWLREFVDSIASEDAGDAAQRPTRPGA